MTSQKAKSQAKSKSLTIDNEQAKADFPPSDLTTAYASWIAQVFSTQREQAALAAHAMENMMRLFGSSAEQFSNAQGKSNKSENMMEQTSQQIFNLFTPSNYFLNNLESLEKMQNMDAKVVGSEPCEKAIGEVIYQNELIDLIKYQPVGKALYAEPILIVPAWFMKHYILDLSAQNSPLEYLLNQGFTVFMVSWRDTEMSKRDLKMEDYRQLGLMAALDAITDNMGETKVHGLGYFLGGTLLTIAAAAMAKKGDDRLKTLSLFATPIDFTDAGKHLSFENETAFLRKLIASNDFAESKYKVGDETITMADTSAPIFVVDTERDHLVTWHSIYKIHQLSDTDITFVLSSGGYYDDTDGEPCDPNRTYRMSFTKKGDNFIAPEKWLRSHKSKQGSWWPELSKWLKLHSE